MSAVTRTPCIHRGHNSACSAPKHDHFGQRENAANFGLPEPESDDLLCNDCDAPTFYDYNVEAYFHTDPDALGCFLIP